MNQKEQKYLDNQLIEAIKYKNLELVKSIVAQGANIHVNDFGLIWTAFNGDIKVMKYLVEQGADIHENNDQELRNASFYGHLEVVKYLVEHGADIHAQNNSALTSAISNGHVEVVKYLVEQGADIDAKNNSALKVALDNNHLEIIKYLLFDCQMQVKEETKDWLIKNQKKEVLDLIEKRDASLNINTANNNSIEDLSKKNKNIL